MSTATQTQLKTRGILLMVSFFAILILIFMPIFPGAHKEDPSVNGLDYLDNFFNQLSKGSANYIAEQRGNIAVYQGKEFSATLKMKSEQAAETAATLLTFHGVPVEVNGTEVQVNGSDFGQMMMAVLDDAESMYNNDSEALRAKYGMDGRQAFHGWYLALNAMEKDLTANSKFAEAKTIKTCLSKAVEPAYNYYGVESKSVKAEIFLLVAALVFYVVYTMWYGFGLLFLFEGMGIKLDH